MVVKPTPFTLLVVSRCFKFQSENWAFYEPQGTRARRNAPAAPAEAAEVGDVGIWKTVRLMQKPSELGKDDLDLHQNVISYVIDYRWLLTYVLDLLWVI